MEASHRDDKRFIKPSIPTPSHLQKFKLFPMDLHLALWYIPLIFYYNGSVESVPAEICHIQESLSNTLTLFYPLAGSNDSLINCLDQGVEFSQARVYGKLDELVLHDGGSSLSEMLLPLPKVSFGEPSLPVVAIKLNVFDRVG